MKRNYDSELASLQSTYAHAIAGAQTLGVKSAIRYGGPAVFVGSGGALAVAQLAADLHVRATGELGLATTPLIAATSAYSPDVALVLFSARGRHPDSALAMESARARGAAHLGLITSKQRSELPAPLAALDVHLGTIPTPPDGFLATNSLLAMVVSVCLAFEVELPGDLAAFEGFEPFAPRELCLIATGPGAACIGVDLEARLTETGMAAVQLADYRNLAHGRHVGLLRNRDRLTLVSVVDQGSKPLADRTLRLLPDDIEVRTLESPLAWPASIPELLVQSMRVTGAAGRDREIDPGKPGVAPFGRQLYHLPIRRLLEIQQPGPIERKAQFDASVETRRCVSDAFDRWIDALRTTSLGGVVVDYDGTCCPTWDRFEPPPDRVRRELLRLVESGIVLGFASGRGKSLLETTRDWMPRELWPRVHVGLYNGSILLRLDASPSQCEMPHPDLEEAARRIETLALDDIALERRANQILVTSGQRSGFRLLPLIQSVLARPAALACKAVASGHSVDVIRKESSKVSVLRAVQAETNGDVLAIGDQGQVGGNDFELLAATTTSLSVDRCSPDPTRCWNIDYRGESGAALLARYLGSIQVRARGAKFVWKTR